MRTNQNTNTTHADPRHVFVGVGDLMERYGIGKTSAYALVKAPDFPSPVAPRTWRLDHVMAREDRLSQGGASPEAERGDEAQSSPEAAGRESTKPSVLAPRKTNGKAA